MEYNASASGIDALLNAVVKKNENPLTIIIHNSMNDWLFISYFNIYNELY